jgi:putative ABC transport system substrate-binding protein
VIAAVGSSAAPRAAQAAKRLEWVRELVPTADLLAVLMNPTNPENDADLNEPREAARNIGQRILVLNASTEPTY